MSTQVAATMAANLLRVSPARRTSAVLLYHANYPLVPPHLEAGLHNVSPEALVDQVRWLGESHDLISIDEWFRRGGPAGTACITFDDGFQSACQHALPRLIELGVPTTMFLNGATLRGEPLWRDKVLHVINHGLVDSFLASGTARSAGLADIDATDFYRETKRPTRNSRVVDQALTDFLAGLGDRGEVRPSHVTDPGQLVEHPLVTYGNHTDHHYVLSSLTPEEQHHEIRATESMLDDLGLPRSRVLSLPFGGTDSVDSNTAAVARELGFAGIAFSRHRVNGNRPASFGGVPVAERYMAPGTARELVQRHLRLSLVPADSMPRRAARRVRATVGSR